MEAGGLRQRATAVTEERGNTVDQKRLETQHPTGLARNAPWKQVLTAVVTVVLFMGCCLSIFVTQVLGFWLYWYNMDWYYAWMAVTKQHFGLLITMIEQWFFPVPVRVSGDASIRSELHRTPDGRLECTFPERMIMIANHQIYTDWLYLWWIAYTNRMHGHIYIILKDSLKWIPLLGWGMQFFSFVFLSRHWETDKPRFKHRLQKLNAKHRGPMSGAAGELDPMWLLLFPEGTNLSTNGRRKSAAWAARSGQQDLRHVLLPRSTGFLFCLRELKDTVEWVYDCTMAYEGVPRGEYGQDIYTLRATVLEGRPPKSISLHFRRFRVADIPLSDDAAFGRWLRLRWQEKDDLLEYFLQNGRFPADAEAVDGDVKGAIGGRKAVSGYVETQAKLKSPFEVMQIFATAATLGLLFYQARKFCAFVLVSLHLRSR